MRAMLAAFLLSFGVAHAQGGALTLREAWRVAEEANPALRAAEAGLHAAEAEAREASRLLHSNPEVTLEYGRRRARDAEAPDVRSRDSAAGISQAFEIAGQPGNRRAATRSELAAVRAEIADTRARVRGEVEQAFFQVLALQERVDGELASLELADQAAAAVAKRVAAGEDSRLDGNIARVEAERSRNQWIGAGEQLIEARAKLAALLQLPAASLPVVAGDLAPPAPPYGLADLLASASARAQLRMLEHREAAAGSRLALERAAAVPDVTVAVNVAREGPGDSRESVSTLSVSIPLPFFRRNDAAIGRAMTELTRAQIERRTATRDGEAMVRAHWERFQSVSSRVARLREGVLARIEENLTLSRKAYQAGEIGILEMVVVNRQVLEARREWLDALNDLVQARISLELAAGWTAPPENSKAGRQAR